MKVKPKPDALDKPYVSKIIRAMSNADVAVYRWTGGLLGSTWRGGSAFPRGRSCYSRRLDERAGSRGRRRERLWPKLIAHYGEFASYQSWTDRVIPVVILEPRS
jgi:hypothetical protein